MSNADKLPSVLHVPCSTPGYSNSISVLRVLKTARELLLDADTAPHLEDKLLVCLDDLDTMIDRVE